MGRNVETFQFLLLVCVESFQCWKNIISEMRFHNILKKKRIVKFYDRKMLTVFSFKQKLLMLFSKKLPRFEKNNRCWDFSVIGSGICWEFSVIKNNYPSLLFFLSYWITRINSILCDAEMLGLFSNEQKILTEVLRLFSLVRDFYWAFFYKSVDTFQSVTFNYYRHQNFQVID